MSNDAQVNVDRGVFTIGNGLGANGKVTMKDNASLNVTTNVLIVGNEGGKGELDLTSGTITCNEFWVGQYFGNIDVTATRVRSEGVFTMDGGTVNVHSWFVVGRDRGIGTFTMNGGTVNKNTAAGSTWGNVIVCSIGGIGTFDMNGGMFYNNSHLVLGESNGDDLGNATFNLNGGTMQASAVRRFRDNATGNLNFNGGVLQVSDTTGNSDYNWCGSDLAAFALSRHHGRHRPSRRRQDRYQRLHDRHQPDADFRRGDRRRSDQARRGCALFGDHPVLQRRHHREQRLPGARPFEPAGRGQGFGGRNAPHVESEWSNRLLLQQRSA